MTDYTDLANDLSLEDAIEGEGYHNLFTQYAILQRLRAAKVATDGIAKGAVGYNSLTYAANVTAGDTTTIGGLVFQWRAAAGAVTDDAYIGVVRGANGTISYANLVAALNAVYAGNQHPNITNVATTAAALANSTKNLRAVQYASGADAGSVFVYNAAAPGSTTLVEGAAPSLTFADTLTEAISWRFANLNLSTGAGFAVNTKSAVLKHSVTTADITLGTIDIPLQFVPKAWTLYAQTSAGLHLAVPDVTITAATLGDGTNVLRIKIDNSTGGIYVPLANTNVIMVTVAGT